MSYRTICSCCGDHVTKQARTLPNNNDSEGNLCLQCFDEELLRDWFHFQEIIDKVSGALSPINRVKFDYATPNKKRNVIMGLLDSGAISWQIG